QRSRSTSACTGIRLPSVRGTIVIASKGQSFEQSVHPLQASRLTAALPIGDDVRFFIHHGAETKAVVPNRKTPQSAPPVRRSARAIGHRYHQSIEKPSETALMSAGSALVAGTIAARTNRVATIQAVR